MRANGKLPQPSYAIGPKSPRYDRDAVDAMMRGRNEAAHAADTQRSGEAPIAPIISLRMRYLH